MRPVELAYRQVSRARRKLYASRYLAVRELSRPVVSIGNIAFGGTGKTPVVISVARGLVARGLRPVILTRGYRRAGAEEQSLVTSDDAMLFGDEPVMLRRATAVPVIVGADRYRSGRWWLERNDCDVFLLDDGFQHVQLDRQLDIVIDDPSAELLRESRSALTAADVILRRGREAGRGEGEFAAPLFELQILPTHWRWSGADEPLETLRNRRVTAFAGLARNEQFFNTVTRAGANVLKRLSFPDHHRYTAADVAAIRSAAADAGSDLIITTEKDAVKLGGSWFAVLHVSAVIDRHEEFFNIVERSIRRPEERAR